MNQENMLMEKDAIRETVIQLFNETDNLNWSALHKIFTEEVLFDMTSMTGGKPSKMKATEITSAWNDGLSKLKSVHHQAGNFVISVNGSEADVYCYAIALHYLPNPSNNNERKFVGSYDFHLLKMDNTWRVDKFKFNLKYIEGNQELEKSAE